MSSRLLSSVAEKAINVDWDAAGPRRVEVTIVSARHLPKADILMGSIDPFCVISFAGSEFKTSTKKNTYSPDYDEKFIFDVEDASLQPGELRIALFDWDRFKPNEQVGEVVISGDRMWDVVRGPPDWEEKRDWRVTCNGQYLVGHDRQICIVTVHLRLLEPDFSGTSVPFAPVPSVDNGARGPRQVLLTVVSARNLPRMDLLGSIDPYCVIEFAGFDFETTTQTNTYTPDWGEKFVFPIADASKPPGPMRVALFDWDRLSTDELVGLIEIPADRMWDVMRAAPGSRDERDWQVLSDGKPVVGKDKQVAVVTLRLEVQEEELVDCAEDLCCAAGPAVGHDSVQMYRLDGGAVVPAGLLRKNAPQPVEALGKGKMVMSMQGIARSLVSGKKRRFTEAGYDLDLTYITPRVIAMGYPSVGMVESNYRNSMADVYRFFQERHAAHYLIVNLCSEREYDFDSFHGSVVRYPFPDHNPPALELMLPCCAHVHKFLQRDPDNVVAIHCKAGKGRTGLMVVAYLMYCGLSFTARSARRLYDWSRTRDGKGLTIISQIRYAHYFEQQLRLLKAAAAGAPEPPLVTAEEAAPAVLLLRYRLHTIPRFDGGTCDPAVAVSVKSGADHLEYPLYSSKRGGAAPAGAAHVDLVPLDPRGGAAGVRVAGDFHSMLRHLRRNWTSTEEVKICHFWLHSALLTRPPTEMGGRARRLGDAEAAGERLPAGAWALSVAKHEMDKAAKDHKCTKFDQGFRVEVFFLPLEGQAGAGADLEAARFVAGGGALGRRGSGGAGGVPRKGEEAPLHSDRAGYQQAVDRLRAAGRPEPTFDDYLLGRC